MFTNKEGQLSLGFLPPERVFQQGAKLAPGPRERECSRKVPSCPDSDNWVGNSCMCKYYVIMYIPTLLERNTSSRNT